MQPDSAASLLFQRKGEGGPAHMSAPFLRLPLPSFPNTVPQITNVISQKVTSLKQGDHIKS